jgi:tight adherence protein B
MTGSSLIALLLAGAALLMYWWYTRRAQRMSAERLAVLVGSSLEEQTPDEALIRAIRVFPPRYHVVAACIGVMVGVALRFVANLPVEVAVSTGALAGVLAHLMEEQIAERRVATIEMQLADAIDLLVGSLRAGASLLAAFESALHETDTPLRPYFLEVAGRIRLGDDPRLAVGDLPRHVPLETFRLFATSLAIHWEVGGSLATTLATVGRTIRDRIELSRRVRTQGIEAHASVGVVLVLAYVLGYLMWSADPDRLEAFVRTDVGTELVGGVIALQAFGLIWMSRIARSTF